MNRRSFFGAIVALAVPAMASAERCSLSSRPASEVVAEEYVRVGKLTGVIQTPDGEEFVRIDDVVGAVNIIGFDRAATLSRSRMQGVIRAIERHQSKDRIAAIRIPGAR